MLIKMICSSCSLAFLIPLPQVLLILFLISALQLTLEKVIEMLQEYFYYNNFVLSFECKILLIAVSLMLAFNCFLVFHLLRFVDFRPGLCLVFFFFGKPQPDVSHKGSSFKNLASQK